TIPTRSRGTAVPVAGAVRVRPVGEMAPLARNRYQYQVFGLSPAASILTVWSRQGPVVVDPCAATCRNCWSVAISQSTRVSRPRPDPGVAAGSGVTRVQSRTRWGSGSPEATPWRNTSDPPDPPVGAALARPLLVS